MKRIRRRRLRRRELSKGFTAARWLLKKKPSAAKDVLSAFLEEILRRV